MHVRFLLGPSGSGKSFRCLTEARQELLAAPSGPPLLFLSPRQATFQVERQLLEGALVGYTRLRVAAFDQVARWILDAAGQAPPRLLNEEGRLMVLRALLMRERSRLQLFHSTARLRGFAQQLSEALREFQRAQWSPEQLRQIAQRLGPVHRLGLKLQDLAMLWDAYLGWLAEHEVQDADQLVRLATERLRQGPLAAEAVPIGFAALWLDGFAELTGEESEFLKALLPRCDRATLAFNLEPEAVGPVSWLSPWSLAARNWQELQSRLRDIPGLEPVTEWLDRRGPNTRFDRSPILRHIEEHWSRPASAAPEVLAEGVPLESCLRLAICPTREAEAVSAGREILRFVRAGGRYREAAVLVRRLEDYADTLQRVFRRFEIPYFLDRREPVGHHPLAELTRSAVRTIALEWQTEDWFGALKTGLVSQEAAALDRLENEALARGWTGPVWTEPLPLADEPDLAAWLEPLRARLVAPFLELQHALGTRPSGADLSEALVGFWQRLEVPDRLQEWSAASMTRASGIELASVHTTFWGQMLEWTENLALAFSHESLTAREWLPILEAGLANQTVGVIPPGLDQVLIGSLDRSRNPDLKLAVILGLNETVFPATPEEPTLLTLADQEELARIGVSVGQTQRHRLARERYLGYIACTRARERLVLTCARRDDEDRSLNPSPFFGVLQTLLPPLRLEEDASDSSWTRLEHWTELLDTGGEGLDSSLVEAALAELDRLGPRLAQIRERQRALGGDAGPTQLSPKLAEALYGPVLETSVSRLEEFAACPFRFFVTSGLHAQERTLFRLDVRHQGSFQHEILAQFHRELHADKKRWRDLTEAEARARVRRIGEALLPQYEMGLLESTEQTRFAAAGLITALENCLGVLVQWMGQYAFDPQAVELAFGIEEKPLPAWEIDLGEGHRLSFRGKIDRVDLWPRPESDDALCVVIDYKSSARHLDPVLLAHGVQLQLLAYLNVLRGLEDPRAIFGVKRLIPAGVFFVNLRGQFRVARHRREAAEGAAKARSLAYQHTGRFDLAALPQLDRRPGAKKGDQFKYQLKNDGQPYASSREMLASDDFANLLASVEGQLTRMGREIYAGNVRRDPYSKANQKACDRCQYQPICRIDPWTHTYRVLSLD